MTVQVGRAREVNAHASALRLMTASLRVVSDADVSLRVPRSVPPPGQAPLVAPNAARSCAATPSESGDRRRDPFGDRRGRTREYYEESCRFAELFLERLPATGPRHVAVLLDNTPDYLFAFGGAALIGGAVVGLNHTRRGEHLLRDIEHTHCGLVITEPRHEALLAPIADRLPPVLTSTRFADADDDAGRGDARRRRSPTRSPRTTTRPIPGIEPDVDSIWALIFTSGTSDAPKAVICSQRRLLVTGKRMAMIMDLGPDDVGYVCMPLFHSNAVRSAGRRRSSSACAVGLGRRFTRVAAGCPTSAATARRTSTTPASRSPTCSRSPSSPTTPTTRCGSRSATRARRRSSRASRGASASR